MESTHDTNTQSCSGSRCTPRMETLQGLVSAGVPRACLDAVSPRVNGQCQGEKKNSNNSRKSAGRLCKLKMAIMKIRHTHPKHKNPTLQIHGVGGWDTKINNQTQEVLQLEIRFFNISQHRGFHSQFGLVPLINLIKYFICLFHAHKPLTRDLEIIIFSQSADISWAICNNGLFIFPINHWFHRNSLASPVLITLANQSTAPS